MAEEKNPFHWRGMVTDPAAFVGRERELAGVYTRLRTLGCISLVGDRRIGKSSLLYQAWIHAQERLGSACRPVFADLLSAKHHTLDGLLETLLKGVTGEAKPVPKGSAAEKLAAFEEAIRKARAWGGQPVAFLDEFEALGSRIEQFGDDLLESWRSLANDGQMAFVSTSARPLDEITQESGFTSSFYNVFAQMKLGEFADQEAKAFADRAMRVGRLEATDAVFVQRVGGRHPLRLQVAAWHILEARRSGQVDFGLLQQRAEAEIAGMMGKQS
jgi:hypothetical protein